MNFSDGDYVAVVTPSQLRTMAARVQELGVRPELEVFDTGHVRLANKLIDEGLIDEPAAVPALPGHPVRGAGRGRAR